MPIIADDEPLLTPPPPVATHARFTKAVILVHIPEVDATGKHLRDIDAELAYDDPRLTDAQRLQFKQTAKFIAKLAGVIA